MFKRNLFRIVFIAQILLVFCTSCRDVDKNSSQFNSTTGLLTKSLYFSKNDLKTRKTYSHAPVDSLSAFLSKMKAIKTRNPQMPKAQLVQIADSLSQLMLGKSEFSETADSVLISDSYLARNAELALSAWQESNWFESISFEVFCNYILPYKITGEIPDYWRDTLYQYHQKLLAENALLKNLDSLYQYHLTKTYPSLTSRNKFDGIYKSEPNYSWLSISKDGDCSARCRYTMYHLRAAGAPATYDYVLWGNRTLTYHAYVGLANKEKQLDKLLENNNDPFNLVNNLNAAISVSTVQEYINEEIPNGLYLKYDKTIAKMYRQTWLSQDKMVELLNKIPSNEVDFNLIKPNMIDVTNQYLTCGNYTLWGKIFNPYSIAYLAVYNNKGWSPVAFSEFNILGIAKFENIGKNIIYLPVAKRDEDIIPLGNPFHITSKGEKREYTPRFDSLINLNLVRKYPLFAYSARHAFPFKGSILQGSDDMYFKECENLDTIKKSPFFDLKIDLSDKRRFQYYRLWTDSTRRLSVNKFLFYMLDKKNLRREVKSRLTRKGNLLFAHIDTICTIDHLILRSINDENYIKTGNEYELFYWDGKWVSAGKQMAADLKLTYLGIPSGTIYWLKCLSGGKEERIFTYENDRQIWW